MNIREKILVIEDEKSIARFISTILTANGYGPPAGPRPCP